MEKTFLEWPMVARYQLACAVRACQPPVALCSKVLVLSRAIVIGYLGMCKVSSWLLVKSAQPPSS